VAGAGFTTFNEPVDGPGTCLHGSIVNCNLYDDKEHVWVNGGPTQTGPSALSDGVYFFAVIEPGGQNNTPNDGGAHNLSDTDPAGGSGITGGGDPYTDRLFSTSGGDISTNLGTHDDYLSATQGLLIRLFPYDDTSNPGGVYILAICRIDLQDSFDDTDNTYDPVGDPVDPSSCKYDAFKATTGGVTPPGFPVISGFKYYDANLNGQRDAGEPGIANWPIDITDGGLVTVLTDGTGLWATDQLGPDDYNFQEQQAASPWIQTGNTVDQTTSGANTPSGFVNSLTNFIYNITVADDPISNINFGNVCIGAGGGHTLGYWSNKNGRATMNDGGSMNSELALLSGLNLRNGNGTHFNPATYATFRTWLLNATATNMAYMLSAQLSAMALNVEAGFVATGALIFAPGTTSANALGFATVGAIMTEANTELGLHGLVLSGSAFRAYQEALKNALDNANNNLNFLQPGPSSCPTPDFQ
jgi:hypothetical protein